MAKLQKVRDMEGKSEKKLRYIGYFNFFNYLCRSVAKCLTILDVSFDFRLLIRLGLIAEHNLVYLILILYIYILL